MASKRGERRRACGDRKIQYADAQHAQRQATRMRRKHLGEAFDAYQCSHCGFWHVGHRPRRVRKAIEQRRRRQ